MLREEVIAAVEDEKFHIYPVSTITEGIELLTGVGAGERNARGEYPENTLNFAVQARLKELAEKMQAFSNHNKAEQERYEYGS
ncbi:MAG TPA: hypothetical protein VFZ43_06010 [Anaerolineales bacterium]